MFKKIIDFFKGLFSKPESEPEYSSGATISGSTAISGVTIVESAETESGETIITVIQPEAIESGETEPEIVSTFKILIDSGHGNDTAGKRSPWSLKKVEPEIPFFEYKWNREIAKEVVDGLRKRGYDAELLVTEENDISLTERANRANKICNQVGTNNVLLVSIHANAAGNGDKWMTGKGWSAFTTKGKTKSDTLAEFLYDEAEKNFPGRTIRKDTSDGDRDWEANFTVIYKPKCPAVLTENFFYDNIDDVKYILSEEGRKAVIKTHVDGIIKYIENEEEERHKLGYRQTGFGGEA
jgi:N-acetylmuramoyl-L-alanine amidase